MRLAIALSATLALSSAAFAQGKNLLFYGNSFSFFNGGVARLVHAIAIEAGHPAPIYQECLVAGQDLHFHATDPVQVAAIGNFLPPGQTWDFVVLQGISTEATQALGNIPRFFDSAIAIVRNVRSHSPAARAVTYQTWARAQGHSYYPTYFPDPLAMHLEVRANYRRAIAAIVEAVGAGIAVNSAVGDCAALLEFDPNYYFTDLHHPANELTLLASMCLFTSIYGEGVTDIAPDFVLPSVLGGLLNSMLIDAATWRRLAGIADRCAAPAVRPYPGSGDQLLLETGIGAGQLTACPLATATANTAIALRLSSRNGAFATAPAMVWADLFPTGQPPMPYATFPEIALDVGSAALVRAAPDLANPFAFTVTLPVTVPGASLLLQGFALAPSAETGNPWFATTDGHEFVLQ
ncbi:MAG: hypothetical protein KDE27_19050 [Planctomycetes bacterium]|nr:hypothetical protein [Planctomycetota bacterium]